MGAVCSSPERAAVATDDMPSRSIEHVPSAISVIGASDAHADLDDEGQRARTPAELPGTVTTHSVLPPGAHLGRMSPAVEFEHLLHLHIVPATFAAQQALPSDISGKMSSGDLGAASRRSSVASSSARHRAGFSSAVGQAAGSDGLDGSLTGLGQLAVNTSAFSLDSGKVSASDRQAAEAEFNGSQNPLSGRRVNTAADDWGTDDRRRIMMANFYGITAAEMRASHNRPMPDFAEELYSPSDRDLSDAAQHY